jgi:hypothetical protein
VTGYRNPFEGQREPLPPALARAGFRQEFAEFDGVLISYVRGPEAGVPVLLVPGQMSLWSSYRWVYSSLAHAVQVLGDLDHQRVADIYRQEIPVAETKTIQMPDRFIDFLDRLVTRYQRQHPGRPASLGVRWLPRFLNEPIRAASMFDPDFARAFVDGRFYGDFSHEAALRTTTGPVLLLHANWNR